MEVEVKTLAVILSFPIVAAAALWKFLTGELKAFRYAVEDNTIAVNNNSKLMADVNSAFEVMAKRRRF